MELSLRLVWFLLLKIYLSSAAKKLHLQYFWNKLDYAFGDDSARKHAILSGSFIPENNLPVGIEVWADKLFVTVPRWKSGIPSTLNYIPISSTHSSPLLIPYPDWKSNELANCETGLATVYRIKADSCDRLWVLDTGTYGIGNTTQNLCPYALNVFDLKTNTRIRRYVFRPEDTNPNTFIANIAVDVGKTCDDAHAYMSDELGYGLIVYSWKAETSWRFQHSYFLPDPLAGDFNIAGLNFQWGEEGIFGIALSPLQADNSRFLLFTPLASNQEFAVSTIVLKNSSKVDDSYHDFMVLSNRGPYSHTTAKVMDDNGIQLYNLIDQNAVGCWNSANPHHPKYLDIVEKDNEGLIFPSDVKIDRNGYVWVMSDRMSTFLISSLDYKDVNFRIFAAPLRELISGTRCDFADPTNLSYSSYSHSSFF